MTYGADWPSTPQMSADPRINVNLAADGTAKARRCATSELSTPSSPATITVNGTANCPGADIDAASAVAASGA